MKAIVFYEGYSAEVSTNVHKCAYHDLPLGNVGKGNSVNSLDHINV